MYYPNKRFIINKKPLNGAFDLISFIIFHLIMISALSGPVEIYFTGTLT